MATRIIGLDIGSRFVRGVILEPRGRSFALVELIEEPIEQPPILEEPDAPPPPEGEDPFEEAAPPPAEAPDTRVWSEETEVAVRRLLERPGMEEDIVLTAAPEGTFMITALELPFRSDREIRAVLGPQLDGRLPSEVEELHLDYMVSGEHEGGQWRVYAGGIPRETMATLMEHWETVETDPRIIDVMPFPLLTAGEWLQPSGEKTLAYVDMGANYTRIIIAHKGVVEIARTIPGGGDAMTDAIARALNMDTPSADELKHAQAQLPALDDESPDAQQLAEAIRSGIRSIVRDLRRTLAAHAAAHGRNAEHVYVSGGAFNLDGLQTHLQEELQVPTSILAFDRPEVNTIPGARAVSHRFVTALGIALRGVGTNNASDFNLRHGPWAFKGAYAYITQRIPALATMLFGLLMAFIFFMSARNALLKAEFEAADDGLAEISRQLFGVELRDPSLVTSRLARGVDGPGLHPSVSAYDIVVRISKAAQSTVDAQNGIELTDIDVDMGRRQVRLSGVCESANAAEVFGQNLGRDSCLRQVQRTNLTQMRNDTKFECSYTATVNCSAPQTEPDDDAGASPEEVAP